MTVKDWRFRFAICAVMLIAASESFAAGLCSGGCLYNEQTQCVGCTLTLFQQSVCLAGGSCDRCDEIVCPVVAAGSSEPALLEKTGVDSAAKESYKIYELPPRH